MDCPVDGNKLRMSERDGVEIDYCPQCRGVWLDRGELDKIIDRSAAEWGGDAGRREDRGGERGHRKKRGWLGEMFEFGE
jgi:Zn-finger nucleic acid-binding protein